MQPKLINKDNITIAGILGDGMKTAELWEQFESKSIVTELYKKTDSPGYEVRINDDNKINCFVGLAVNNLCDAEGFELFTIPAYLYASFDVVVSRGYDSENAFMNKWLSDNKDKYSQGSIIGKYFAVECYNERFRDGIVEIWIPLNKERDVI